MNYDWLPAPSFWDCVKSMRRDDRYKAQLVDTIIELQSDPFSSSKLNTHAIGTSRGGKKLFASDVGGRRSDRRIVWQLVHRTIVPLLYGRHAIYNRAKCMRIAFDERHQQVMLYEQVPGIAQERLYHETRQADVGSLFMAWTDEELASYGFPSAMVTNLRRLNTEDELLELADKLGDYSEIALNLVVHGHPDGKVFEPEPSPTSVPEIEPEIELDDPTSASDDSSSPAQVIESETTAGQPADSRSTELDDDLELEARLTDKRTSYWFVRTEPEFLAGVMGRPIEDWMIFLHPDQRSAVQREYNGPARVRGAAGTGKTVIGLHRAAWLAERNRQQIEARKDSLFYKEQTFYDDLYSKDFGIMPVLFTTYINSLPPVFESLYHRLPGTHRDEVEFINVDKLARRVCNEAGDRTWTNPREINAAYTATYKQVVTPGTPLADSGFSKSYLRDEISKVIKGRAINTLEEYLNVDRTGRRASMRKARRTQVWELMTAWDAEMEHRGTIDFCDVITRALRHAREIDTPRYSSVIVDEAQDLTLAGLQFLRALVNAPDYDVDRPNGLVILGDAGQRIYPGGFTLRQAGVEVRGRTTVLIENYRNTDEIINTALAVAGECHIEDLEEEFRRGSAEVSTLRKGPRPILVQAYGLDAQLEEIVRHIGELTESDSDYGLGDIGVLVAANRQVSAVCKRLAQQEFTYQTLDKYDGTPNANVKVGTYHRAKGLEFKVVFLPQVTHNVIPRSRRRNQSEEEYAEARDLDISQLFVAMTRARDLLIVLYDHQPSEIIQAVIDHFDSSA